jgi:hypothetical protein
MFGLCLWNPDTEEGSDMSGQILCNSAREPYMSVIGVFGGRVDF